MSQIAFIFPGQGSQYVGMAQDFYQSDPKARDLFQLAEEDHRPAPKAPDLSRPHGGTHRDGESAAGGHRGQPLYLSGLAAGRGHPLGGVRP